MISYRSTKMKERCEPTRGQVDGRAHNSARVMSSFLFVLLEAGLDIKQDRSRGQSPRDVACIVQQPLAGPRSMRSHTSPLIPLAVRGSVHFMESCRAARAANHAIPLSPSSFLGSGAQAARTSSKSLRSREITSR